MSGTEFLTWKGDVANGINPYRPGVADMGGVDKRDDAKYVPSPDDPSASEWNQIVGQVAAMAKLSPAATIDVRFASGTPSVFSVVACNDDIEIADVTVVDVGTGIVTLAIPATLIPDVRWGKLYCQETGNFGGVAFRSSANTLRCEIYDLDSGAAADKNFIVDWG